MEHKIIPQFPLLTPNQWEVLELMAQGLKIEKIGEKLVIDNQTIENYLNAIFSELGDDWRSRQEIIDFVKLEGWIEFAQIERDTTVPETETASIPIAQVQPEEELLPPSPTREELLEIEEAGEEETKEEVEKPLSPLLPTKAIQVSDSPLIEMIKERGLLYEVDMGFQELTNNLRILANSAVLKTKDYEETSNLLEIEFKKDSFYESLDILYHFFGIIGGDHPRYSRPFHLLKTAMEHKIIPQFPLLTPSQWKVLGLMALGLKNIEIAEKLEISEETVSSYVKYINSELGGNRTESAIIAMREGWVDVLSLKERLGNRSSITLRKQLDELPPRRKEIAILIGDKDFSNIEIAKRLSLAESTVRNHVMRIFKKLDLRNSIEIAIFFFLYREKEPEEIFPAAVWTSDLPISSPPIEPFREEIEEEPAPPIIKRRRKRKGGRKKSKEKRRQILQLIYSRTKQGFSPEEIETEIWTPEEDED